MEQNEKIGMRIQALREEKGITQIELAKALNVKNRENIARWELGTRELKAGTIIQIAKYFNVSADYLLGLSDVKTTEQNIKIACEVTGLSEKAINMIKERGILTYSSHRRDSECDIYSQVLDTILTCADFYMMVSNYAHLYDISEGIYSSKCLYQFNFYDEDHGLTKKECEIIVNAIKRYNRKNIHTKEQECDVCRYLSINYSEALSDIFDQRKIVENFSKKQMLEYLSKEDTENAKHNTPKE